MKLWQLEHELSQLSDFLKPKIQLEQYATDAHIASRLLWSAHSDIEDSLVVDLGCGCGILSIGAKILGASEVIGIEIDSDAIKCAQSNMDISEEYFDIIQANVYNLPLHSSLPPNSCILLNPPFGTKNNAGADMKFLECAFALNPKAIYSLHKSSTRAYILERWKDCGWFVSVLATIDWILPKKYKFHRKESVSIAVDLIRFTRIVN